MSQSLSSVSNSIKESLRRIWSFPGGITLNGKKFQSNQQPITSMEISRQLEIPLTQHIGQAAEPVVQVGETVLKGQVLAYAEGIVSAPVHASSSGTVIAIEERLIPHPSGLSAPCVVIETDGYDQWIKCISLIGEGENIHQSIATLTAKQIEDQVARAGIVGLGGALYPCAAKLHTAQMKHTHTLIINAAECEPYITCDDVLMRSRPEEIILGILLIKKVVGATKCLIGIEDNKPEAYQSLLKAISGYWKSGAKGKSEQKIEVIQVPTRYPAGGEKQLIQVLTGKEVPVQSLPMDIGIICHNVTTAAAVYQAVYRGEPLISRIVTVTGGAIKHPQNIEVPFGTPIRDVLNHVGMDEGKTEKIILGGPMMGFALPSIDIPVTKGTNCILASEKNELATPPPAMPCIRCGRCADSCPMSLLPQQMYWYARARDLEKIQDYNIFDCIECGCCSYVCPSNIPLVQYFRYAKTEIWDDEKERNKANLARERHEFRLERLEKAKIAKAEAARLRKEKLAKKKALDMAQKDKAQKDEAQKKAPQAAEDDTSPQSPADLIQEAIARSKAKKARQQARKKNTDNLTEAQQKQIDAVNERRRQRSKATDKE